jgi:hypothetical protein
MKNIGNASKGEYFNMNENFKIKAFNKETGELVGTFDSINKAANRLFIRNPETIRQSLVGANGMDFSRNAKGVTSYKTGIKYKFEKA